MATHQPDLLEHSPSHKQQQQHQEAEPQVSLQLPAPSGWKKKVIPKKGRSPGGSGVLFIAPSGEEIKNKRQLDQYLKSNPVGPASSEFDWSTGETPRRSVRISEKVKVTESPEDEPPKKKRGRKPLSEKKKEEHEGKDGQEDKENGETEKEADAKPADEKVGDADMKEAEPVKEAAEAVNPASESTVPDQKSGEKAEENNEAKSDEPAGNDTASLQSNIGAEAGPHEGSVVNGN